MTMTTAATRAAVPVRLRAYEEAGAIDAGDVAAARMLVGMACGAGIAAPSSLAWVAICLALRSPREGHTCVDLERIADWAGGIDLSAADHPEWPEDPQAWIAALESAGPLVGTAGERRPFILDGRRLYLARALAEEQAIAAALLRDGSRHVGVLLGGPGSGKTWTLANDLIEEFERAARVPNAVSGTRLPRIALAAPTGKAAARMTKALRDRCQRLNASPEVIAAVEAAPAVTVHRLLGYGPNRTPRFRHGPDNPLDYDIVVVDEVSMLSSSLMHHLLAALSDRTRIRFVGDPDQLASVESGTVLADIAAAARPEGSRLHGCTRTLTGQHRYDPDSTIAQLAIAIREGDVAQAVALLEADDEQVAWIKPRATARLEELTATIVAHAQELCDTAAAGADCPGGADDDRVSRLLEQQGRLQVLCARRSGLAGVAGWNDRIERRLGAATGGPWYAGRPIMVTRNNPDIELFNGDVGVVVPGDGTRMEAVFSQGGTVIRVPVPRLEDVTTVHALTIHKSQGSEYGHAIVVLPEERSRLLTRELLYTAVTRAAKKVTVVGSREVIAAAIARPVRRASGLADRL